MNKLESEFCKNVRTPKRLENSKVFGLGVSPMKCLKKIKGNNPRGMLPLITQSKTKTNKDKQRQTKT